MKKKTLNYLRSQINYINYKIIKLLSQRELISIDILKNKICNNFKIQDKKREVQLFQKIEKISKKKKINLVFIKKIFKLIIKNSIYIQKFWNKEIFKKKKIYNCGYLGPIGSYSYIALNTLIRKEKKIFLENAYKNFESIITDLNKEICKYAILPIENNISGIIPEVYEILKNQEEIYIIQEVYIKIKHTLLTIKNSIFSEIKNVYSHQQPFKQCSNFLKNFPKWKKHCFNSTSAAMTHLLKENKKDTAVIGNIVGGSYYNLKKIATNISNKKKNITRFILISKKPRKLLNFVSKKITMLLTIIKNKKNKKKILNIFRKKKIILLKLIKNKNINKKKEITYFIEIQLDIESKKIQHLLFKINKYTKRTKFLGCYPIEEKLNNSIK
ncbi:bifunctional chorismate mutase/prephenate dehydratase [Buchnera aphidicola]|uniref:Bifunctional chorismate mutase/prephenate dehydratase n=1 Tax=Buchnera aphidicola subsp. Cinara cedri (strain Cc) TaxID=372461 RepID=Q057I7_BUCCC|nr:bifunctional chorismate mutase/prephenate dehydratase [Buchnera aphidicola]ABJ90712.1 bifunctional chorismate mutase P/prephenate dehydratase [Buchnera aphidicola BCc]